MAKKVKYTQPLLGEVNAAGYLILVPGAVVQILQDGVPVQVFSDEDGTEIDTPNLPSGVASGSAGVSTRGELTVWLTPGSGYSGVATVGQTATTFPIPDISPDASDVAAGASTRLANTQTVDYTLVLADAGKAVEINSATAKNVTVPPNASVAFPVGTIIEVPQVGAGAATLVAGAGVTITGDTVTPGQGGSLLLRKTGTNTWWSAIWSVRSGTYVPSVGDAAKTTGKLTFGVQGSGFIGELPVQHVRFAHGGGADAPLRFAGIETHSHEWNTGTEDAYWTHSMSFGDNVDQNDPAAVSAAWSVETPYQYTTVDNFMAEGHFAVGWPDLSWRRPITITVDTHNPDGTVNAAKAVRVQVCGLFEQISADRTYTRLRIPDSQADVELWCGTGTTRLYGWRSDAAAGVLSTTGTAIAFKPDNGVNYPFMSFRKGTVAKVNVVGDCALGRAWVQADGGQHWEKFDATVIATLPGTGMLELPINGSGLIQKSAETNARMRLVAHDNGSVTCVAA
jgi:hypothetical protein